MEARLWLESLAWLIVGGCSISLVPRALIRLGPSYVQRRMVATGVLHVNAEVGRSLDIVGMDADCVAASNQPAGPNLRAFFRFTSSEVDLSPGGYFLRPNRSNVILA